MMNLILVSNVISIHANCITTCITTEYLNVCFDITETKVQHQQCANPNSMYTVPGCTTNGPDKYEHKEYPKLNSKYLTNNVDKTKLYIIVWNTDKN